MTVFGVTGAVVCFAIVVYAAVSGRWPERAAAGGLGLGLVVWPLVQDCQNWIDPQYRLAVLDGAWFLMFATLVTLTQRRWVLYAAAWQFLSLLIDLLHGLQPRVAARAFLTLSYSLGYCVFGALAFGAWSAARHRVSLSRRPS